MPTITRCRIASDVDFLSKVQLEEVCGELKKQCPKLGVETIVAGEETSDNNRAPNSPIRVARLMNDLLNETFDGLVLNATHLPARLPDGLTIGAITNRLIPYDVLISSLDCLLDELSEGASVVANDERREAQLLYYRPDLKMVRTRGSVDSVIQKVKSEKVDAAVLAAGDVERLQKQDHVVEFLTCSICIPAAGQGSLAILVRSNDEPARRAIHSINDPASYSEIVAEWAFLESLGIESRSPVGVLGSIEGRTLELEGMIALPDGRERIHALTRGTLGHEAELGEKLATEILEAGGKELLQELDLV
ncbi:MAG: hypothetical protein ACE5EO_08445 [Candidatus Krumholzibacteriia bacterium]